MARQKARWYSSSTLCSSFSSFIRSLGVESMLGMYRPSARTTITQTHPVQYSTAQDSDKTTAMIPTDSSRRRLLLHDAAEDKDHRLKKRPAETQDTTGLLDQLLLFDEQITNSIGFCALPKTRFQRIAKKCCKILEISGHGVPWFSLCGLLLIIHLLTGDKTSYDYGLNMLLVLIVDILVVAPIKVIFKRPRPPLNIGTIPMSVSSVDNYAFPSGHASRCVALAAYFCYMPPFNPWTHLWYIWGLLVSLSRVALGRHHVLDVGAGMIAGLVIFDFVRRSGLLLGV